MGVNVRLENVETQQMLFTKQIRLSPRYILINNSERFVLVRQQDVAVSSRNCILLAPQQRSPLYWFSADKPKQLNLNYAELPPDVSAEAYQRLIAPLLPQKKPLAKE